MHVTTSGDILILFWWHAWWHVFVQLD